jgi:FixJ family two-component response regulator
MPEMNGRALASRIIEMAPKTKILFMSGYTDDAIAYHGVLDPEIHFLAKPFTGVELMRKVREALDSGTSNRAQSYEPDFNAKAAMHDRLLEREALCELSKDVVSKLSRAVMTARHDELIQLIDCLQTTAPTIAVALRNMANNFDYDGLRELLSSREEQHVS